MLLGEDYAQNCAEDKIHNNINHKFWIIYISIASNSWIWSGLFIEKKMKQNQILLPSNLFSIMVNAVVRIHLALISKIILYKLVLILYYQTHK